jgi:hypothetical protein
MTKIAIILALGAAAISAPAMAQHSNMGGYAPMVGATDPCVLGTNVQPGTCVGPVRVTQAIVSQGGVAPQQLAPPQPMYAPQPAYVSHQIAYAQPAQRAPVQMAGCVPGYGGPTVPCNGAWVAAPMPAPVYVVPSPAPVQMYVPAPAMQFAPQVQQVGMIPTSFFTGGITYGAGFPTETTYTYGGGGFGYSTGGTRFSGVRERSPTPLVPPSRQRHAPPSHSHHGCGC